MKQTVEGKHNVKNGIRLAVFCAIAILIQANWLYQLFFRLNEQYAWLAGLTETIAVLTVLFIYGKHINSAMKMPWIMLILVLPLPGIFLYFMIGWNQANRAMRKRYEKIDEVLLPLLPKNEAELEALRVKDPGVAGQCRYLRDFAKYPVYQNTAVEFYPDAAGGLAAQLEELRKAEKFIFLEYHAVEDSTAIAPLLDILKEKAAAGVEVRLFYDYVGSMGFVGNSFAKKMTALGIQCRVFNPIQPVFNLFMNHRDHRKITVIDGRVGFVGGYNLADEYFHVTQPYGYWLDTGVKLTGQAVRSLTVTFLENWNAIRSGGKPETDFDRYLPDVPPAPQAQGFVQPYADSPMDNERVGENVYINVLRNARDYAWFITPYLIITDEMNHAFAMAAKSGVDVRIITPGIPDKKLVYSVTRSYYAGLVSNGVRVYEYTPGFCHAKQCVSDDKLCTCGTINLDFRSLYHHFENGVLLYDCAAVGEMKAQFEALFPQCREVTGQYTDGRSSFLRFRQLILRLFAPLL